MPRTGKVKRNFLEAFICQKVDFKRLIELISWITNQIASSELRDLGRTNYCCKSIDKQTVYGTC